MKVVEDVLRKELNEFIAKKMNSKLKQVNDEEFEKGMSYQQRLFNTAIKHIEKKLRIKIY